MSEVVRAAIDHYQSLLDRHLEGTRTMVERCGGRELRPHFVAADAFEQHLRAAELVSRGLLTVADRLARDVGFRRKLGIPSYLDRVLELDAEWGTASAMARFDALVDRTGALKVIEYNSTPGFDDQLGDGFASLPIAEELAQRFAFRTMKLTSRTLDQLRGRDASGGARPPVIAIPSASSPAPPSKYHHIAPKGEGWQVLDVGLTELRFDGERLLVDRPEPVAVDVLVLQSELVTLPESADASPVLEAIRARAVRVLNGVSRGLLCGYKHLFEVLSNPDYAAMFSPEVAAALAKHVPWTRVVRNAKTTYRGKLVDLMPFVADSRERWVLKPSGGHSGNGVLIGNRCTDSAWRQALRRALTQPYIVQERVLGVAEAFPYSAPSGNGFVLEETTPTVEPFVWGGTTAADAVVRTSSVGNHTRGGGGTEAALWIIEGAK